MMIASSFRTGPSKYPSRLYNHRRLTGFTNTATATVRRTPARGVLPIRRRHSPLHFIATNNPIEQLSLLGRGELSHTRTLVAAFFSNTPASKSIDDDDDFNDDDDDDDDDNDKIIIIRDDGSTTSRTVSDNFTAAWGGQRGQLIRRPVGTMEGVDVRHAQELLKALRTHRALDRSPLAVMDGFALLDRLAEEIVVRKNRSTDDGHELTRHFPLDLRALGAVLASWKRVLRRNREGFPLTGQQVIRKIDAYRQVGLFEPNAITYTVLIDSLRDAVQDPVQATRLAQEMLDRMIDASEGNAFDTEYLPNRTTVLNLIYVFARSRETPERSESLVRNLYQWYKETKRTDLQPTLKLHAGLIRAHARAGSSVQELVRIAFEAWGACKQGALDVDMIAFNAILHVLAGTKERVAADAAAILLKELVQENRNGTTRCRPNQSTFLAVITALGKTGQVDRAESVMQQMEDMYEETADPSVRPNRACYGALIWAHVSSGSPSKERAEATLLRMSNYCDLDAESWDGVLASWAHSGDEDAAERTATVIQWLEKGANDNLSSSSSSSSSYSSKINSPSRVTHYNSLMGSYTRSQNPQQGARLAADLFQWMREQEDESIRPNANTYLSLLSAWRKAKDPRQAESALRMACQEYRSPDKENSLRLEAYHFNICISAWTESNDLKACEYAISLVNEMESLGISPDLVTYNTLIKLYSKLLDHPKCLSLLREAEELYQKGRLSSCPDIVSYNTVVAAMVRSGDPRSIKQAMSLFREMQNRGIKPDRATYNTMMSIYARRGEPEKIEQVFRSMQTAAEAGGPDLRPHFKSYTTLLQAWAKAGQPESTQRVLEEMIDLHESGQLDGKPGTRDFNALLQAWLKSQRPDASSQCIKTLEIMHELAIMKRFDCAPDVVSYNTVISALIRSHRALEALSLLRKMQSSRPGVQPNMITYTQVLMGLLSPGSPSDAHLEVEELIDEMIAKKPVFWSANNNNTLTLQSVCKRILASRAKMKFDLLQKVTNAMRFHQLPIDSEAQEALEEYETIRRA